MQNRVLAIVFVGGTFWTDFVAWAADTTDTSIYWLNGMAGTGRMTIAFTFSHILVNIHISWKPRFSALV